MFEMRWLTYYTIEKQGETAPDGQPMIGGRVHEVSVPHTKLQYRYKTLLGNWTKWKDVPTEVIPPKEQPRGLLLGDDDPRFTSFEPGEEEEEKIRKAAKQISESIDETGD